MEHTVPDMPNNLYAQLVDADLIHKIRPLLKGWHLRISDGKFVPALPAIQHDEPWVHPKKAGNRRCTLWWRMLTQCGILHPFCAGSCWKTVVRPRTVKELFQLHTLQDRLAREFDFPCKCGIERRVHVHGLYGGYFYADSLEQGREMFKWVRMHVDNALSPSVPVILKKGCTEIELARGREYECTYNDRKWSAIIDQWFEMPDVLTEQPGIVKIHVMRKWLEFAWQNGDETAREFNEDQAYTLDMKTYHRDVPEDTGPARP